MDETTGQQNVVAFSDTSATPVTAEWGQGTEDTPVVAVVSAVAEASGMDPLELPALNDAIDPEALNDLFTARAEPAVDSVKFQYAGHDVAVRGTGNVEVRSTAGI